MNAFPLLWLAVALFVVIGTLFALAESALTRVTRVRAMSLESDGRRNAALLVRLTDDPPRYLNSVYLGVMVVQNGSAVLVAILAERMFGSLGVTLVSLAFTLLYFVVVEAMAKTFGVLHSDRVALALAPFAFAVGRSLAWPTRLLITVANVLLPGRGLRQGPFVSESDIRSMAEVGSAEGSIPKEEEELIHSVFEFGDTVVREVMVPRPDVVSIDDDRSLRDVQALVLQHGYSRIPVVHEDLDDVVGVVYAKDVLKALHLGRADVPLRDVVRQARFVPESKRAAELLKDMQRDKFHLALATDEYGSTTGLITMEDLIEELVGEIVDEYDRDEPDVAEVGEGIYRFDGKYSIADAAELLEVELPDEEWDTVAGLVLSLLGRIPSQGEEVTFAGHHFRVEEVRGRRIAKVLVSRLVPAEEAAADAEDAGSAG